jgi:hypothetical protein
MPKHIQPAKTLVDITVAGPSPYEGRIFPLNVQFLEGEWMMQVIPAGPSREAAFYFPIKDLKVWAPAGHL